MSTAAIVLGAATRSVRYQYYRRGRGQGVVDRLPKGLRTRVGLDDPSAIRSGRIQIGQAPAVLGGMLHVDEHWRHPHLDYRSPAFRLTLPSRSALEIVAIDVLNHVDPYDVLTAVGHWRRVLRDDGRLVVGVDDDTAALRDDDSGHPQALWARQPGAEGAPGPVTSPMQIPRPQHRDLVQCPLPSPRPRVERFRRRRHVYGRRIGSGLVGPRLARRARVSARPAWLGGDCGRGPKPMSVAGQLRARRLLVRSKLLGRRRGARAVGQSLLAYDGRSLSGVTVRCRRQGLQWALQPSDISQRTLYCLGDYEGQLRTFVAGAIRPGDVVYDIGAHVGLLSCPLARTARDVGATLFSFEPAPDSVAALRRNLALNDLDAVAEVVPVGLSDAAGTASLSGDSNFGPDDSSVRSLFGDGSGSQSVELVRFDDWWAANGRPRVDVVKMDVEGAESLALGGMREAIKACRPRLLVVEMKDYLVARAGRTQNEAEAILVDLGYDRQPPLSELIGRREPAAWLDENIVFIPRDSK